MNSNTDYIGIKRIFSYDVIRIIAILAVIMIHCSNPLIKTFEAGTLQFASANILSSLSTFAIQFFVMLSGTFILDEKRNLPVIKIKNKILKLFIILFSWSLFYAAVYHSDNFLKNFILGHSHLWYLYMLIGLYLITPILRLFIKEENKSYIRYFLLLAVIFQFLPISLDFFFGSNFQKFSDLFYINCVSGFISYYVMGWLISSDSENFQKYKKFIYISGIIAFILIITSMFIYSVNSPKAYKTIYNSLSFPVFVYSVSAFIFIKNFAEKYETRISDKIKNIISFLAQLVLGVYLIHASVLSFIRNNVLNDLFSINADNFNPFFYITILFLITTFISFVVTFLLSKIKYIKKLIKI